MKNWVFVMRRESRWILFFFVVREELSCCFAGVNSFCSGWIYFMTFNVFSCLGKFVSGRVRECIVSSARNSQWKCRLICTFANSASFARESSEVKKHERNTPAIGSNAMFQLCFLSFFWKVFSWKIKLNWRIHFWCQIFESNIPMLN